MLEQRRQWNVYVRLRFVRDTACWKKTNRIFRKQLRYANNSIRISFLLMLTLMSSTISTKHSKFFFSPAFLLPIGWLLIGLPKLFQPSQRAHLKDGDIITELVFSRQFLGIKKLSLRLFSDSVNRVIILIQAKSELYCGSPANVYQYTNTRKH